MIKANNKKYFISKKKIRNKRDFVCPNCHYTYSPMHNTKEEAFNSKDLESREQWLSRICSDDCWDEFVGDFSDYMDEE